MTRELSNFGDHAVVTMQSNPKIPEGVGIDGYYHIVCHDKDGNLKWEEEFPNLVVAVGKQLLMNNTFYNQTAIVGPYLGLISNTFTPASGDTMGSHTWTEFANYTYGGSAVRATLTFTTAVNGGQATPGNIVSSTAGAATYTITGAGGTVYGCFLVTGTGAVNTISSTAGVLYSEGLFGTAKATTAGDTVSVTYSTTATS